MQIWKKLHVGVMMLLSRFWKVSYCYFTPILNYGIYYPSSISHCFDDYVNGETLKWELTLFHLKNTMMRLYRKKLVDADKEMGWILKELRQFSDLEEYLSNRERKIIAVYKISS